LKTAFFLKNGATALFCYLKANLTYLLVMVLKIPFFILENEDPLFSGTKV